MNQEFRKKKKKKDLIGKDTFGITSTLDETPVITKMTPCQKKKQTNKKKTTWNFNTKRDHILS